MERRINQRYKVEENLLQVNAPLAENGVGYVVDIGTGGLAFEYICNCRTMDTLTAISIGAPDDVLKMEAIPCKVVSDVELQDDLYSVVRMGRTSVAFGDITEAQKAGLARLIDRFAAEEMLASKLVRPERRWGG